MNRWKHALATVLDRSRLRTDVLLAPFTTFRIGGRADLYYPATDAEDLSRAVSVARERAVPWFLLGTGANILIGDRGVRGLVIHNHARRIEVDADRHRVTAESGAVMWPDVLRAAVDAGLSGLEHFPGIPSSVGGALWQNLHFLSPPPERHRTVFIEEVLHSADVLTVEGERRRVGVEYFEFGYDDSILHHRRDVVLAATFQLRPGDRRRMEEILQANLAWRARRHPPLDTEPSAGSIFQKLEGVGAGRLIEECGLKGCTVGGAMVTHRHANIFINRGHATADDVRRLIDHVRTVVARETGHELQVEISFVGEFAG
jgi:UDP-N-acetylmuramate dehydrogenase